MPIALSSKSFASNVQENIPVQLRKDPMQIMVILHDVAVQVSEDPGRDQEGRPRGNDSVETPMVKGNGDLQRPSATGIEIGMAECRGQEG